MRVTESPLEGANKLDEVALECELLLKTDPLSSSHSESMRDDRRPDDDEDELRREEDKLAMRPKARIAVPVF